jgi:uridylate kinase
MDSRPARILLKLSGEALKGEDGVFSPVSLRRLCSQIAEASVQWGIVVGAGNLLRGARSAWLDRIQADAMGMLGTVLNALALRAYLEGFGRSVVLQSAVSTEWTAPVSPREARAALDEDAVVIFAGGTGNPLFSTDTAAAIRAVSIEADILAKGSNVAGVFDHDPAQHPQAELLDEISYDAFLAKRYGVMDQVAVEICRAHGMPIEVFDLDAPGALLAVAAGRKAGTRIR